MSNFEAGLANLGITVSDRERDALRNVGSKRLLESLSRLSANDEHNVFSSGCGKVLDRATEFDAGYVFFAEFLGSFEVLQLRIQMIS